MRFVILFSLFAAVFAPPSQLRANVVINEIMFHPQHTLPVPEPTELEWIELYNTDQTTAADISGWALDKGVALEFPAGTTIAPGGFLIAAASADAVAADLNVAQPWTGRLSNNGETIRLVDASDTTIDEVRYSNEGEWATKERTSSSFSTYATWEWSSLADGGGASLERHSTTIPGSYGQNWTLGSSPGTHNRAGPTATNTVITDVRHTPAAPRGGEPVSITARVISDSATSPEVFINLITDFSNAPEPTPPVLLVPEDSQKRGLVPLNGSLGTTWIDPTFDDSSWHSFFLGAGYDSSTDYDPFTGWDTTAQMRNRNGTVYLRSTFDIGSPSDFLSLHLATRIDDGFVAYLNGHLIRSFNAPESPVWNSTANGNNPDSSAIQLSSIDVSEHLDKLVAGKNVLAVHGMNTSISSSDFLISYELSATTSTPQELPNTAVPMHDDGQHGDGEAGDGVYGYVTGGHPSGQVVGFRIGARSNGKSVRVWPQHSEALYQHDDHDNAAEVAPVYRVVMRPEDSPGNSSDQHFDATFIIDDQIRYGCSVRGRGNSSRRWNPFPMRVDIPQDNPLDNGSTKLNLNTLFPELQLLGMRLFDDAGLPAPSSTSANVLSNGIDRMNSGLPHVHLEPLGDEFIDAHFPPEQRGGNLYKKNHGNGFNWVYRGNDPVVFEGNGWTKRNNSSANDWSDLAAFHQLVNIPLDDPAFAFAMEAGVDMEQWLRWLALNSILANREGGLAYLRDDDYTLYKRPNDGRWIILPHDLDSILGRGQSSSALPTEGVLNMLQRPRQIITHPAFIDRYYAQIFDLLETVFAEDRFEFLVDSLLAHVDTADRESIKDWMAERRDYLYSINPLGTTIHHSHSEEGALLLSGHVDPGNVSFLFINGEEVAFDSTTGAWQLTLEPLSSPVANQTLWTFLEDGTAPAAGWAENGFDDSAWGFGLGPLGYGDASETGELETRILPGGSFGFGKHVTAHFRTEFEVENPGSFSAAYLNYLRDDGIALYLNGTEIARDNLDLLADHLTPAASEIIGDEETTYLQTPFDPALLIAGTNTLAAEVHISDPDFSPDLRFDARISLVPTGSSLTPRPGLQRYTMETFDSNGQLVDTVITDIENDALLAFALGGTLTADTTLYPDGTAHLVTSDLIIPPGVTLTLAPGTSLIFSPDVSLEVLGTLIAEGTPTAPISFISDPGLAGFPRWAGIFFRDTAGGNSLSNTVINGATALDVTRSSLEITDSKLPGITADAANLTIERCAFPGYTGRQVTTSNGGNYVIRDSDFSEGAVSSLHLTGTAFVDGNFFRDGRSWAIYAEGTDSVIISRNVFANCDRAVSLAGGVRPIFEYNTVYGADAIARLFSGSETATPADGIYLGENVFAETAELLEGVDLPIGTTSDLTVERNQTAPGNFVEAAELGSGNFAANAFFTAPDRGKFNLRTGAPKPGAMIDAAITISGEPPVITTEQEATLTFAGPGMDAVRYRINGGAWSDEISIPLASPRRVTITLAGLSAGEQVIEAIGRDVTGRWQAETEATLARSWTVDPSAPPVILNEIGAGWVEVKNRSSTAVDISNSIFTSSFADASHVPPGTTLPALATATFPLAVDLLAGGYVRFGDQTPITWASVPDGYSLSLDTNGNWLPTPPSRDAPNTSTLLDTPAAIVINEWLARPDITIGEDFVELFNTSTLPVDIGGTRLSDSPTEPGTQMFSERTFLAPGGFLAFDLEQLDFGLTPNFESLLLADSSEALIDYVEVTATQSDTSYGRIPDGDGRVSELHLPSPGYPNSKMIEAGLIPLEREELITTNHVWKYLDNGQVPPLDWRAAAFDDSGWPSGPSKLGFGEGDEATPIEQSIGTAAYQFRSTFFIEDGDIPGMTLYEANAIIDDGVALYIDGIEVSRWNLPTETAIDHTTLATSTPSEDVYFELPVGDLTLNSGTHSIAASVHNANTGSADLSFDLHFSRQRFIERIRDSEVIRAEEALTHLRITEVHFHPPANEPLEFIELKNTSSSNSIALGGIRLDGAVTFTFPAMTLAPGEYVIVAQDASALRIEYGPSLPIAGSFSGRLANGDETLSLVTALPTQLRVLSFQYQDDWDQSADGGGASLNIRNPHNERAAWRESSSWIGNTPSPGAPPPTSGFAEWATINGISDPTGDSNGDGVPHLVEYTLGLDPNGPRSTPILLDGDTLAITLPNPPRADTDLVIEFSVDGSMWTAGATKTGNSPGWTGTMPISETNAGADLLISATLPPIGEVPSEFYRLRAISH